jgi:hypothetical protein
MRQFGFLGGHFYVSEAQVTRIATDAITYKAAALTAFSVVDRVDFIEVARCCSPAWHRCPFPELTAFLFCDSLQRYRACSGALVERSRVCRLAMQRDPGQTGCRPTSKYRAVASSSPKFRGFPI